MARYTIWGKCSYCGHVTWVWVLNREEQFCPTHMTLVEEIEKRFQDFLELERV
jgi:hypothetical protein